MWNLESMRVKGNYMGDIPVAGVVTYSHVAYGGDVQHHIKIDAGFSACDGRIVRHAGEVIIVSNKHITEVQDK